MVPPEEREIFGVDTPPVTCSLVDFVSNSRLDWRRVLPPTLNYFGPNAGTKVAASQYVPWPVGIQGCNITLFLPSVSIPR